MSIVKKYTKNQIKDMLQELSDDGISFTITNAMFRYGHKLDTDFSVEYVDDNYNDVLVSTIYPKGKIANCYLISINYNPSSLYDSLHYCKLIYNFLINKKATFDIDDITYVRLNTLKTKNGDIKTAHFILH